MSENKLTTIRAALLEKLAPLELPFKAMTAEGKFSNDGDLDKQAFSVMVVLPTGDDKAQEQLDELLANEGESSVRELLEADRRLNELVTDLYVERTSGAQAYPVPGAAPRVGAEWKVIALLA